MKWLKRIAIALVVICIVLYGGVYALSNRIINRVYPVAGDPVVLPTDSASLARGERLSHIVGCYGCHGATLAGHVFFDESRVARLIAPNIPAKLAAYSDADLERLLRRGVRPNGTSPFVMPPPGFYHLSDADVGGIIASIRSQPRADSTLLDTQFRILGRLGLTLGEFETSIEAIDTTKARIGDDSLHLTSRRGEYLARVVCAECHGDRLEGDPTGPTPGLSQAVGYSLAEFVHLLRTGEPRGQTKLDLMARTAKGRLHLLTDDEIAAVYDYIKSLPATGIPAAN